MRSPGTAYVLLHHYMGEIDGAFRAWGIPKGGTGGVSLAIASAARALGASPHRGAGRRIRTTGDRATGVVLDSGEEIDASVVLSSADAKVTFLDLESGDPRCLVRGRGPPVQVPRLVRQGEPGGRSPAGLHLPARRRRAPPRRHLVLAVDGRHGARLRRREVRPLEPQAVYRHDRPGTSSIRDGAARQARHQLLRPVRPVPAGPIARELGRPSRGVRRCRHRPDRRVRAEHPRHHHRPPGPHPARHRAHDGADRGEHLPGRAEPRAVVLQPPRRAMPGSDRQSATCG